MNSDKQIKVNGGSAISYHAFVSALAKEMGSETLNALHAAVGCSGEAGELLDAMKKVWAYNKPVDRANIVEELGDLNFYMQLMQNVYYISDNEILQGNADKLAVRYKGLVYSDTAAQARADKVVEQAVPMDEALEAADQKSIEPPAEVMYCVSSNLKDGSEGIWIGGPFWSLGVAEMTAAVEDFIWSVQGNIHICIRHGVPF